MRAAAADNRLAPGLLRCFNVTPSHSRVLPGRPRGRLQVATVAGLESDPLR